MVLSKYAESYNSDNFLDFELETIAHNAIWVAKKKYVQNIIWKDGKTFDAGSYISTKGLEIIQGLRGHTSGYAIPHFVIDAPGGGGKIPVMPNYIISQAPGKTILRNYEGMITTYYGPSNYENECECEDCVAAREGRIDIIQKDLESHNIYVKNLESAG